MARLQPARNFRKGGEPTRRSNWVESGGLKNGEAVPFQRRHRCQCNEIRLGRLVHKQRPRQKAKIRGKSNIWVFLGARGLVVCLLWANVLGVSLGIYGQVLLQTAKQNLVTPKRSESEEKRNRTWGKYHMLVSRSKMCRDWTLRMVTVWTVDLAVRSQDSEVATFSNGC